MTKKRMNFLVNTIFLAVGVWTAWLAYYFAPDMPAGLPVEDRRFLHITRGAKNFEVIAARIHSLIARTHPIKSHRFVREQLAAPLLAWPYRLIHQNVISINGVSVRAFVHKKALHADNLPAIIYIHGGGWSSGSSQLYAPLFSEIVMRTHGQVKILAIDYRLVPDFVYPVQFHDCLKAVKHILQHTDEYGLDPRRIVLAGSNLAAAVTLRLRDEHFNATGRIKAQILIHPVTNAVNFLTRSMEQNDNVPLLSRANVIKFVLDYMDEEFTQRTSAKMELNRHIGEGIKQTKAWRYLKSFNDPDVSGIVITYTTPWKIGTMVPFFVNFAVGLPPKPISKLLDVFLPRYVNRTFNLPRGGFPPESFRNHTGKFPVWFTYFLGVNTNKQADHTVTPSRKLISRLDYKLRDPYMFPMMAESLSNLTRTYVLTCEYDVLRDDGVAFAQRLRDEGTEVELNQLVCFHGALHFYSRSVSGRIMLDQLLDWLNIELSLPSS